MSCTFYSKRVLFDAVVGEGVHRHDQKLLLGYSQQVQEEGFGRKNIGIPYLRDEVILSSALTGYITNRAHHGDGGIVFLLYNIIIAYTK